MHYTAYTRCIDENFRLEITILCDYNYSSLIENLLTQLLLIETNLCVALYVNLVSYNPPMKCYQLGMFNL